MGVITTGSFAKLLWPGLNKIMGQAIAEFPEQWSQIFASTGSGKAYEEVMGTTGFGLPRVKTENGAFDYDEESQAFLTRFAHTVYALGFQISREIYEDDQYGYIGKRRANALAFSMRQGKEIRGANVINRAFTSGYNGGDGVTLCNASHPNYSGGTQRNQLATAADLSEAALEQSVIDLGDFQTDRGLKMSVQARKLVIPKELAFEAERILKTPYRVSTANNDINALKSMGSIPEGYVVNNYLTDTNAWFLLTNNPDGLKHFQRRPLQFGVDNDFDTEVAKYKATERDVFGWEDWRGIFGSAGA